jgi:hypothetical protein
MACSIALRLSEDASLCWNSGPARLKALGFGAFGSIVGGVQTLAVRWEQPRSRIIDANKALETPRQHEGHRDPLSSLSQFRWNDYAKYAYALDNILPEPISVVDKTLLMEVAWNNKFDSEKNFSGFPDPKKFFPKFEDSRQPAISQKRCDQCPGKLTCATRQPVWRQDDQDSDVVAQPETL